ncbi:MAG: UDP-glucose/GDP-mannose dehydrogenase family protein [Nanoarchaeota archaeon]|nr:UDP-glucose/GDP-mannose dehydrogenase family protein [Nanoarchaeota archaeon]MBU1632751.1 UDP-glucose/GDP-mannose dehydrogenase family protein [Nanoarchaeota archaeon]MBU1876002.1 UDP-glucose/GDP-mannose dehydrogenase family protein [Nanoarchaeota archaeon]
MKITICGCGYVGLVTGALFADRGNKVICVDNNPKIVNALNSGKIHIFEPGLGKLVQESVKRGNLSFIDKVEEAVQNSDVIFLAVGTPSNGDGSFNLSYIKEAAKDIGRALRNSLGFKVVVVKSTVPQGSYKILSGIINQELGDGSLVEWAYVSNPETLAEGTAVKDFQSPDRIIIGTDSDKAFLIMKELYYPFIIKRDRIMRGSPADAELAKLFSNTALATRVAMINEMARVADITPGADMDVVRRMVCEDSRIGYKFMFPSPGYGGSCFPKDIQGLVAQAKIYGYNPKLLSVIHESNEVHKNYMGERVAGLINCQNTTTVAVWGVTFKPQTDDMRDAASIPIITRLINEGINVNVYDPQDNKARGIFGNKVTFFNDQYEAVKNADALILLTEWRQFDSPDFSRLKTQMKGRQLFDLRNRWLPEAANRNGFDYFGVGRNYLLHEKI